MVKNNIIIVGNIIDNYFAIDLADLLKQKIDIADLISLKIFPNTEFCPRFTTNGQEIMHNTGRSLEGKTVIIVSVHSDWVYRNELAVRNFILARAAKDNSAERVILVEPDLFYSAQDRGPKEIQGTTLYKRTREDLYKFNGQAFTASLYAQMLKIAGVDKVITIHNHSYSCKNEYKLTFGKDNFVNLFPDRLYHSFICNSGIVDPTRTVLVAPDNGAMDFVQKSATISHPTFPYVLFEKTRKGERSIRMVHSKKSQLSLKQLKGKDVVVLDDMVRTGSTIIDCCNILVRSNPRKIIYIVSHFLSSEEIKQKLSNPNIEEIITTNTLPTILNRDHQGRLRKKMAVLKITKWIANYLNVDLKLGLTIKDPLYMEDISDKNPRSRNTAIYDT